MLEAEKEVVFEMEFGGGKMFFLSFLFQLDFSIWVFCSDIKFNI